MKISVLKGDLTAITVDAIVNPANSHGVMGGGVAGGIRRKGGQAIEDDAMAAAPIPIGATVATTAGKLPAKAVIHAPTMMNPAERTNTENIRKATLAALAEADRRGFSTIAFPGMGTGVGRVNPDDAATVMVAAIRSFKAKFLVEATLVDVAEDMVKAFRSAIERKP
ncbi:MAG: macro domain-containing protein [Planctomycetota bacterium]